jgi:hypothetical protein
MVDSTATTRMPVMFENKFAVQIVHSESPEQRAHFMERGNQSINLFRYVVQIE